MMWISVRSWNNTYPTGPYGSKPTRPLQALFFTMGDDCDYMFSNSVRLVKSIKKDIGKSFVFRDCRRAYGQFYINRGVELEMSPYS